MAFKIEQIAICPADPQRALRLLSELGLGGAEWTKDHVVADGIVRGANQFVTNEADLHFNYELFKGEFEVLHYTDGPNWMDDPARKNSASHLGMHCTEGELLWYRSFFRERGILVIQEVATVSHTNPVIAGKRLYHYVIFDTKPILGIDLKFIVRKNHG